MRKRSLSRKKVACEAKISEQVDEGWKDLLRLRREDDLARFAHIIVVLSMQAGEDSAMIGGRVGPDMSGLGMFLLWV